MSTKIHPYVGGWGADVSGKFTVNASNITFSVGLVSANLALASGVVVSAVLDEDTMSSDSASALATQQSIKAYVDSNTPDTRKVAFFFG